jgi:twitching motility protein PilT
MRTDEAKRIELVEPYMQAVWDRRGTDLLFTVGAPPLVRVNGELAPIEGEEPLTPARTEEIVRSVLGEELAAKYDFDGEVDFSLSWGDKARFRGNAFHQRHTCALSLRVIPFEIPSFEELGLPEIINKFVELPMGLVLVTGPTGSGKSTTLASMLDYINANRACHIVTIEDPIEYVHQHRKSAVNQREVGEDTVSFDRALRSVLREDPDVLLVGEMRDLESIQATLTIAETGHLVFATLHTNDSAQALDRIIDVFPAERRPQIQVQLAHVLAGVIYQRLLPRPDEGLVAAFEVLVGNHAIRNLIREGKTRQIRNVIATHQVAGMQTIEEGLSALVASGDIDLETALSASMYPKEIRVPTPTPPAEGEQVPTAEDDQVPPAAAAPNGEAATESGDEEAAKHAKSSRWLARSRS